MSRDFRPVFRAIPAIMRKALPSELRQFHWQATSWMAKASYGNKDLHYELWVRHTLKVVELGLHFEADALTNARLLGAFRARAHQVKRGLGTAARIEEWDKGWTRVWEPFPLEPIDDAYAERIRGRFVDYVRVLEPMLRDELPNDVHWKLPTRIGTSAPRRAAKGSARRVSR